ncbi:hypothetical protein E1B28_001423 [Marasmius oreades]|uniref:WHIM1 domain-containing protein n=1 Tax=Marasmius oreades TaxID=181124 RepID=A0A9P7V3E1_9AGAR|nr:uncharacterized protein E1B28_001423 [Marasmius oreades]KAG7099593.1 hypothetical protein E1B28_001423 [Marasmius oreades]
MSGRGHACPPSDAIHPSDRWESLFIYSFICKFTKLRSKVEGLETPMDLENALLSKEPTPIINAVLIRFILNLRPHTRNLNADQLSSILSSVLADTFKTSERTVFWDEDIHMNVDPLQQIEGGFFAASWDLKLKILRQLVELQLCHSTEIKGKIDRAWGVHHNKNKKKDSPTAPPPPDDPESQSNLQLLPLGQDITRKRYWAADFSTRIYISTNPWKITATFQSISSTREEYVAVIEQLKSSAPPPPKTNSKKRPRLEIAHMKLIQSLEARLVEVDKETARIQRVRRKIEQRQQDLVLAECRQLRSRRQTRKPDYVYDNGGFDSEDDDEYNHVEDEYEDDFEDPDMFDDETGRSKRRVRSAASVVGQRRSTRTAVLNANGKRETTEDPYIHWRGERRSARLGAPSEFQYDYQPPMKRARTADSSLGTNSSPDPSETASPAPETQSLKIKVKRTGAAALKPDEVALEQIAGKKPSKFWVYAVPESSVTSPPTKPVNVVGEMEIDADSFSNTSDKPMLNGELHPVSSETASSSNGPSSSTHPLRRSMEGSFSSISDG